MMGEVVNYEIKIKNKEIFYYIGNGNNLFMMFNWEFIVYFE